MSSTRSNKHKWLLIEWNTGGRGVVHSKLVDIKDPKVGSMVKVRTAIGGQEPATVVGFSYNPKELEKQLLLGVFDKKPLPIETAVDTSAVHTRLTAPAPAEDVRDFSVSSGSDEWAPSMDESSEDDERETKRARVNLYARVYNTKRTSRGRKPSQKAEAVNRIIHKNRKTPKDSSQHDNRNMNYKSNYEKTKDPKQKATPEFIKLFEQLDNRFQMLFSTMNEMKTALVGRNNNKNIETMIAEARSSNPPDNIVVQEFMEVPIEIEPVTAPLNVKTEKGARPVQLYDEAELNGINSDQENSYHSDDSRRSDDNVLITNKYHKVLTASNKKNVQNGQQNNEKQKEDTDWIPIGSGKTLIHKDQLRRVNWKSYSFATRTLLTAVFPRKVLATHSLTGKPSPAFQNKPAKMLLDPKIVSDIVIEVADRFGIRDNLVRTIITTKLADESKMYKMRVKRKTLPANREQENVCPDYQDPNQTF